tara:strand:- start:443 stop:829 length:387 start_codon:yes stop_codon:yes gene_type:complete
VNTSKALHQIEMRDAHQGCLDLTQFCLQAVANHDYRAFKRHMRRFPAIMHRYRVAIDLARQAGNPPAEEEIQEIIASHQVLARKLREWQIEVKDELSDVRRRKARKQRVNGAYKAVAKVGHNVRIRVR